MPMHTCYRTKAFVLQCLNETPAPVRPARLPMHPRPPRLLQVLTHGQAFPESHRDWVPFHQTNEEIYGALAQYYDAGWLSLRDAVYRLARHKVRLCGVGPWGGWGAAAGVAPPSPQSVASQRAPPPRPTLSRSALFLRMVYDTIVRFVRHARPGLRPSFAALKRRAPLLSGGGR